MDALKSLLTTEDVMKLSLFPEILGGFAHELAQPLNAVNLACEVMRIKIEKSDLPDAEKDFFKVRLQGVKSQVSKASGLIDQFRSFLSDRPNNTESTDIETAVDFVIGLTGQQFSARGINLSITRSPGRVLVSWPRQIVEIVIAQCLIYARNRLETLKRCAEPGGNRVSCSVNVSIGQSEVSNFVEITWQEYPEASNLGSSNREIQSIGIISTRETVMNLGGNLTIDSGLLNLSINK
ncbi:MAG: hypothetical protein AB7V04_02390 [Desulfomonilaceae bacterium]